ncbi:hypothetical protein LTR84_008477 [Exophiala bonariae]|uniref:Uncharacterized protein n=1 Tax=Exophiala bonariae TaxID=1690606 RepID=A0AAV9N0B3_9EURO|nr:hypothetical protein LTR84_008477 [Exophiala bonariae]
MSAVLEIDDVPHIVRYGSHDDKAGCEKCWIHFYRSGTRFDIHVTGSAVDGTRFAERWIPLLKSPEVKPYTGKVAPWVQQWEDLCTLVISACLGTIRKLVRGDDGGEDRGRWKMLEGYLKAPSYKLEVVKKDSSLTEEDVGTDGGGVSVKICEGPIAKPTYEHWPLPAESIRDLPDLDGIKDKLPVYHARDLEVLGADNDWRHPPSSLRAPDGTIYTFVCCERNSTLMPENIVTNGSVDEINAYCRLFTAAEDVSVPSNVGVSHIRKLKGVVVTEVRNDFPAGESDVPEGSDEIISTAADDNSSRVVGILLNQLPSGNSLGDWLKQKQERAEAVDANEVQSWKEHITQVVELLHSHRITVGGYQTKDDGDDGDDGKDGDSAWYYINQHTIEIVPSDQSDQGPDGDIIGSETEAWLSLGAGCTHHPSGDEEAFQKDMMLDWEGVDKAFTL